ncbi:MAG: metallophosphoesterase [Planctomycetes bacterium]|nr:metallophosphoesterase [Planctomycetota bacterium]
MTLRAPVRRYSDAFLAFALGVEVVCAALGGRRWYRARHLAPARLALRRERVVVPDLPDGLAGLRLAQLSDLHAGRYLGRGDLRAAVDAVNAFEPDVVALTGDFVSHHWSDALALVDDLARLAPRRACVAVFGNHDYRDRAEGRIAEAFAAAGVRVLRDECLRVDTGAGVLALVGLEDLEEAKRVDLDAARADVQPGDVEVVLCHHPAGGPRLARPGCALVLSGHTHGVQVDLPFLRRFGPAHPGLRLTHGATTQLVSRGVGVVGLPLRVGAPAEVVLVELAREGAA